MAREAVIGDTPAIFATSLSLLALRMLVVPGCRRGAAGDVVTIPHEFSKMQNANPEQNQLLGFGR
ncbi:hypothetical protein GCM10011572_08090 [Pseudoduganella buxea]|uniref:Uncharacterized protein n=1 Tax=Pseudoduganella buxea TaxID=1949069 RepID=A0ABQ1K9V2_9BURK|nr:hypothetical protein GCM10011572_08090 [Pseudoduganella buxea]